MYEGRQQADQVDEKSRVVPESGWPAQMEEDRVASLLSVTTAIPLPTSGALVYRMSTG